MTIKKKLLLFSGILFFVLVFFYSNFYRKVPLNYFDEQWWVWDSAMLQKLLEFDFNDPAWQGRTNIDQPALTKYVFGAWLYPAYLKEKREGFDRDFIHYLISRGYYYDDGLYPLEDFKKDVSGNDLSTNRDSEKLNRRLQKYDLEIYIDPNLIYKIRKLNIFLLALSVVVVGTFFAKYWNYSLAIIFSIIYGLNPLIVQYGLMAQTEALFLLLFNSSLVLMFLYFKEDKNIYLVLFTVAAGLTFSTKLHGVMLVVIFLIIYISKLYGQISKVKPKIILTKLYLPIASIFFIFIILNPVTFKDPFNKISDMFTYRFDVSGYQATYDYHNYLPTFRARVEAVFKYFYQADSKNGADDLGISRGLFPVNLLLLIFVTGIIEGLVKTFRGNFLSYSILVVFLFSLGLSGFYLVLNWPRYFVHLVLFFVYYELAGVYVYTNLLRSKLSKIQKYEEK